MGYKSGGLSYFEDGGSAEQDDQVSVQAKPIATKGKMGMPALAANVPVSQSVLDQMAQLYMQRQEERGGFRGLLEALKDATAWGGTPQDLIARDKFKLEREAEDAQFGNQIAQYRSALASQKAFQDRRAKELGLDGAPTQAEQPGQARQPADMFPMPARLREVLSAPNISEAEYNKEKAKWAQEIGKAMSSPEFNVPKIDVMYQDANGNWVSDKISDRQFRMNPDKYTLAEQMRTGAAPGAYKPGPGPAPPSAAAPAPLQTAQQPGAQQTQVGAAAPQQAPLQPPAAGVTEPAPAAAPSAAPAQMAQAPAAPQAARPAAPAQARGLPPTVGQAQRAAEIEQTRQTEEIKQGIAAQLEGEKDVRKKFMSESSQAATDTRLMRAKRIQTLVEQDPKIAGILSQTGYASALGGLLSQGISTPNGPIGLRGISEAIAKTTPGMNMAARKELAQHLANLELDAAQMMQGQGQISDSERIILQNSSIGIDDPSTLIHKTARIIERRQQMMKQMREIYGAGDQWKRFAQFENSPRAKAVLDAYYKDITNIANSESNLGSKTTPKVGAYADPDKEARYQAWKKSQGQK